MVEPRKEGLTVRFAEGLTGMGVGHENGTAAIDVVAVVEENVALHCASCKCG